MTKPLFRIDLRRLILWMCLSFVALALISSFYAAYKVQREVLLQNTLEVNRVYAQKLAQVTETYLQSSRQMLEATAFAVRADKLDPTTSNEELARLARMTNSFNSLFVVNATGRIIATLPPTLGLIGNALENPQAIQLLKARQPTVSIPFLASTGRWLIMLAHPIYELDGDYAGFVGGTIYLHETNVLQTVLGEHYYNDGSYLYVVDQLGSIIYHPTKSRIGTSNTANPAVQALMRGERGATRLINDSNAEVLAGYAPVSSTGWGIVVQRPIQATVAKLKALFWRTFYYSLPVSMLCLLGIWWLAKLIARPLQELAEVAASLDNRKNFGQIQFINGWYFEAALIRKALLTGFSAVTTRMRQLHRENATDSLTALTNRRGLDAALADLEQQTSAVAVVIFDIDHFKAVNDTHGHAAGDDVLKIVASMVLDEVREDDVVARVGGEEFVVLLPDTDVESARHFAERLRLNIEGAEIGTYGKITISLGIAHYPEHAQDMTTVLQLADAALYEAKHAGRNCTRLSGGNTARRHGESL